MSSIPKPRSSTVGSAAFKSRCLELIEHVRESGAEYVVTRHGKPVAKLVPIDVEAPVSIIGCLRGSLIRYERPLDPVPAIWSIDQTDQSDDEADEA